ncbi:hypothetical protein ABI59_02720 [Acidobacteria bacterium Mor1]|nr:hypothetical protein ABI59_02720 [Acidobacteria bacterium Mor1]
MRKLILLALVAGLAASTGVMAEETPPLSDLVEETHRQNGAIRMEQLPFLEKESIELPLPGPIAIPGRPTVMSGDRMSSPLSGLGGGNGGKIEVKTVAKAEAEMKSLIRLLEEGDE